MSEYSHGDSPCEPRANTPEFDKGYEDIKWDDKHDDLGRVVKKEEAKMIEIDNKEVAHRID